MLEIIREGLFCPQHGILTNLPKILPFVSVTLAYVVYFFKNGR